MKKTVFIIAAVLFFHQYLFSQKIWIEGYDIMDVKRILYKGDSVIAFYQPKGLVFRNANMYPEYFTGLPDSLPSLPDGKYLLFSYDIDSKDTTLFHEWYMKDGKRDSVWIKYHENGSIYEILQYRNGKREGRQIQMDEKKNVIADWTVRDGFCEGDAFLLDEDMNYARGKFHKGTKVGIWTYSNQADSAAGNYRVEIYYAGRFSMIEREYKNNALVSETLYKKKRVIKYINGKKVRIKKDKNQDDLNTTE